MMIDITEKVTDYFELEKVVTIHSNRIPCIRCINYYKCQAKRAKANSPACRNELRATYRENRYLGLVVAVEKAIDWKVIPTEHEVMMYDAFINLKKELSNA